MAEGLKGLRIYALAEALADEVWDRDNRQFQFYARGSLEETGHWLRRAHRRNLIPERRCEELLGKVGELAPQLNAYIRSLERKAKEGRAKL